MTSCLQNRKHLQAVWKCFSNEQATITLFKFLSAAMSHFRRPHCSISLKKNIVYLAKKICIYEMYLTCGLYKVNTTVSLCSGCVSSWFDSTLQSKKLHLESTPEKSQSCLFTSDPTLPHWRDVVSDLSHITRQMTAILAFSLHWRQYSVTPHWIINVLSYIMSSAVPPLWEDSYALVPKFLYLHR